MSSFIINFTNTSGEKGTVVPDNDFNYSDKLNDINESELHISGSSVSKRSLIEEGSTVEIKRNRVIEFVGEVIGTSYLDGGAISARCLGAEVALTKTNGDYSGSPWKNVASKTIFQEVIGEFNLFSLGTIDTGVNLDFRASETSSYMNVIQNLQSKTGQDREIDYTATPFDVNILNHKGSVTSVETLNDGIDFTNLQVDRSLPKGNKILVYGKGDGANQIKSVYPANGQNVASQTDFGIITWTERDPTIVSVSEANKLANVLAAAYGVVTKTYRFDLTNPSKNFVSGDVITLNSGSKNLSNEEVRIVGIERGVRGGQEYMTLQVTSKEFSKLLKNRDRVIGEIQRNNRDQETYMQGTTNILTFSQQINATSTAPLRTQANLPDAFIKDEIGNIRVNSFTCDYDVDPFRSSVGTATESNVDPLVTGVSDTTSPPVSGTSGSENPRITGDSGALNTWISIGSDPFSTISCPNGVWTTVASIRPGSSFLNQDLSTGFVVEGSSGGAEDIDIRVVSDNVGIVWSSYSDGFRDSSVIATSGIHSDTVTSSLHDIYVQIRPQTGAITISAAMALVTFKHSHDDGNYATINHSHNQGIYSADLHDHGDGNYRASLHNHSVSIGDDVSDAGAINATSVDIYVDHWNGTSWINKHSILATGKTLDTDVDISNGGTLPDAGGYWRTRIFTNNASADLVNSIIKVKHELDT